MKTDLYLVCDMHARTHTHTHTHTKLYLLGLAASYSLRDQVDIPVVLFFFRAACVCLGDFVCDIHFFVSSGVLISVQEAKICQSRKSYF